MIIAPIAFIILIIAGYYLGELYIKTITIYLTLSTSALVIAYLLNWDPAIWFSFTAFLDAILIIHIFKRDITIGH
jgi:hypothetical protein